MQPYELSQVDRWIPDVSRAKAAEKIRSNCDHRPPMDAKCSDVCIYVGKVGDVIIVLKWSAHKSCHICHYTITASPGNATATADTHAAIVSSTADAEYLLVDKIY